MTHKLPEWKEPVLRLVAESKEKYVQMLAQNAACELGAQYDSLLIWAERIEDPDATESAMANLRGIVENTACSGKSVPDAETLHRLRTLWVEFLKRHESELRSGKSFSPGDPVLDREMFPEWRFRLPDGTEWP